MPTAEKMVTDSDFSETSLEEAAVLLNGGIEDLTVYVPRGGQFVARRLQGRRGFALIIVPDAFLCSKYAWAAELHGRVIWSPGAG